MSKTKLKLNKDYRKIIEGIKDALQPSEIPFLFDSPLDQSIDRTRFTTGILVFVEPISQYIEYRKVIIPIKEGNFDIKHISQKYGHKYKTLFTREYFNQFMH